jgi:hypothetical protein
MHARGLHSRNYLKFRDTNKEFPSDKQNRHFVVGKNTIMCHQRQSLNVRLREQ